VTLSGPTGDTVSVGRKVSSVQGGTGKPKGSKKHKILGYSDQGTKPTAEGVLSKKSGSNEPIEETWDN